MPNCFEEKEQKKKVGHYQRKHQGIVLGEVYLQHYKACLSHKGLIPQRWESVEEPNLEQLLIRLEEEQQR